MLSVSVKGITRLQKSLKAARKREVKALETAVKVEGYRLKKQMAREIRQSAPGGVPFAEKSVIGSRISRSKKPLRKLAAQVRYQVARQPFSIAVGFTGPRVSKSWKRIALKHQEGGEFELSKSKRFYLIGWGAELGKRSAARKYFFLKKSTRIAKYPARPIVAPFWRAHENEAWRNIRTNYRKKLAGERI